MKKNKPEKNTTNYRKKDYVTNKLLLVFTFAFALLILLMNIGRRMKNTMTFVATMEGVKVITVAALAVAAIGVIMMIVERITKRDIKYRLFTGLNITIGALFVALCTGALSVVFSPSMLMLLYIFVPSVVVLYIVYYSYQREFFMIALASAISGVGIWLLGSELINSRDMLVIIAAAAAIAVCAAITVWAQLGGGKIKLGGKELEIFKSDARYGIVYLTFVLAIMLLAAAYLVADLAIYFIFGVIGYIVLLGVYYTVKLI